MIKLKGLIHHCTDKFRKMFFDPEVFPQCPFCKEDLTKLEVFEYEVKSVE